MFGELCGGNSPKPVVVASQLAVGSVVQLAVEARSRVLVLATVTSVWKKLFPTTYVSTSVKVRLRLPSTPDTTVVTRYGLAAVPEPVSD